MTVRPVRAKLSTNLTQEGATYARCGHSFGGLRRWGCDQLALTGLPSLREASGFSHSASHLTGREAKLSRAGTFFILRPFGWPGVTSAQTAELSKSEYCGSCSTAMLHYGIQNGPADSAYVVTSRRIRPGHGKTPAQRFTHRTQRQAGIRAAKALSPDAHPRSHVDGRASRLKELKKTGASVFAG